MNDDELEDTALRITAILKAALAGDLEGYEALNPPGQPNSMFIDGLVGFLLASISIVSTNWNIPLEAYIASLQASALESTRKARGDTG